MENNKFRAWEFKQGFGWGGFPRERWYKENYIWFCPAAELTGESLGCTNVTHDEPLDSFGTGDGYQKDQSCG